MSVYEASITNPKKQLEFYKDHSEQLQQENQELKKHLEVPEHCNLKTLKDYKSYYEDTTKEKILEDTYIDYCAYVNLAHEYGKLKKQLEEKDTLIKQCELSVANVMDCYCNRTDCSGRIKDSKQYDSLVQQVENQQKEFIEYLEYQIKIQEEMNDIHLATGFDEILQKYKEIIGKDINVSTKGGENENI